MEGFRDEPTVRGPESAGLKGDPEPESMEDLSVFEFEPIESLSEFEFDPDPEFARRVRLSIDRRETAGSLTEMYSHGLWTILLDYLTALATLLRGHDKDERNDD